MCLCACVHLYECAFVVISHETFPLLRSVLFPTHSLKTLNPVHKNTHQMAYPQAAPCVSSPSFPLLHHQQSRHQTPSHLQWLLQNIMLLLQKQTGSCCYDAGQPLAYVRLAACMCAHLSVCVCVRVLMIVLHSCFLSKARKPNDKTHKHTQTLTCLSCACVRSS